MPTSMSVEPSTVKSTNRPGASARVSSGTWSSPKRRMSTHIGTSTTSKAMKKRIASRARKVARAPVSTSRMQPRKVEPGAARGVAAGERVRDDGDGEQGGEQDERGRDAVDAEVPADAERADPRHVDLVAPRDDDDGEHRRHDGRAEGDAALDRATRRGSR